MASRRDGTVVVGIDAGKSTGLARITVPLATQARALDLWQFTAAVNEAATHLTEYVNLKPNDVCVAEQFDLRPHNQFVANLDTVRINAILSYEDVVDHWQTPAQAKGLVSDENLKNLGMWPTGKDVGEKDADDVRDALRHALYYVVTKLKHMPTIAKGWPDE